MNTLLKAASAAGLLLTVVPAALVLFGGLSWDAHALWMAVGTALWFGSAPFWMREAPPDPELWEQRRTE